MRINVYAEELTERVEIVEKEVDGKHFYGIRLYLYLPTSIMGKPPDEQHYSGKNIRGPFIHHEGDDDSSAITFWIPWTKEKGNDFTALSKVFGQLFDRLAKAREKEQIRLDATQFKCNIPGCNLVGTHKTPTHTFTIHGPHHTTLTIPYICPQCGGIKSEPKHLNDSRYTPCPNEFHQQK